MNAATASSAAATVSGDSNDSEIDGQPQLAEYDDDGDDGGDEMTMESIELYTCSSCGLNFKSVPDHIQKHHPGQDVLIDISDENGATAIKTEKTLDLTDDDVDDVGDVDEEDDDDISTNEFITSHTVGMVDGEFLVYDGGDNESLEGGELIVENDDSSVVYTYDNTTGQITRATTTTVTNATKRTATKIDNGNKSTVSVDIFFVCHIKPINYTTFNFNRRLPYRSL